MTMLEWARTPRTPLVVNGVTLEYACHGAPPSEAPTIVMLHEGLGSVELWRDFPEQVAECTGFGVFVYSRQGYGASEPIQRPRPLDFMTREALDVLPQVLDRISFRKGLLFGHSDGATIAALYAGSVEDHRVRGLILMAPHFFTEPKGLAEIARVREAFESGVLRRRLARYHADVDGAFLGWADVWLDSRFADWDVTDTIDYLRIPVLAIQSRDDQYGTLAQIAAIEERAYSPVDTLILDGCNHAPHQEQPYRVLEAVEDFTERLQRIEAAPAEKDRPG
jgi:pimeloyl-ACP methyl ester carboxylesterase